MARIHQCKVWNNAKQDRLVSSVPAYAFQILYITRECKGYQEVKNKAGALVVNLCRVEHMQWRGEFPDGTHTQFFDIPPHEFERWRKRTESDKARPELQLTSEYSETITKDPSRVIGYLQKLESAKKWWQGKPVNQQGA